MNFKKLCLSCVVNIIFFYQEYLKNVSITEDKAIITGKSELTSRYFLTLRSSQLKY